VAGPVIQATVKSTFEDGVRSGGSGSDFNMITKCPDQAASWLWTDEQTRDHF
jgi:hypothetical protein